MDKETAAFILMITIVGILVFVFVLLSILTGTVF